MSAFNVSMFESIKGALASSESKSQSSYTEILACKPGNTYTVRLLPFEVTKGYLFPLLQSRLGIFRHRSVCSGPKSTNLR